MGGTFKIYPKRLNYGLLLSLLINGLILLIPVSMVVKESFKEIELFVMAEEKPVMVKQRIIKQETKRIEEKPIVQEHKEVRHEEKPDINVIESAVITNKPEAIALPEPEPSLPSKTQVSQETQVITEAKAPSPSVTEPLKDMKFGQEGAPSFLKREMPIYPMLARRLGKEGKVVLRLTIDEKGNLLNVEVIEEAGYGFTEAAIEAVKKSTFTPAMKNGKPIASRALLPIRFTLRRD